MLQKLKDIFLFNMSQNNNTRFLSTSAEKKGKNNSQKNNKFA